MNKKELLKIYLLLSSLLSSVLIICNVGDAFIPLIILVLFIMAIPIYYFYNYDKYKNNKVLKIIIYIIIIITLIFLAYTYTTDIRTSSISSFMINVNDTDLTSTYGIEGESIGNNLTIFIYLTLLMSLFLISLNELHIKTNKINYSLMLITLSFIIIININYFINPLIHLNEFDSLAYSYVRQYDIHFIILLTLILIHKFINKNKESI